MKYVLGLMGKECSESKILYIVYHFIGNYGLIFQILKSKWDKISKN